MYRCQYAILVRTITKKHRTKAKLKMFYQTYTACKPPKSPPGSDGMGPSAAAWRYLQRARSIPSPSGPDDGCEECVFCPWWSLTLTFRLQVMDQTRLPCEFGANLFSGSRDIWGTNGKKKTKKVTDSANNRTLLACGNNTNAMLMFMVLVSLPQLLKPWFHIKIKLF